MKNTIKLTALALLLSAGLFTATSAKANVIASPVSANVVTVSAKGVIVKLDNSTAAKAIVMIYDNDGNVIRKDILSSNKGLEKAYILNQLDYGDYTLEVTSNKQVVKKAIHVYDEGKTKTFIVSE